MRQAAAREVREECGIQIRVGEVIGTLDNIVHDPAGIRYHYAIVDFRAEYLSGELAPSDELMDAAWVRAEELDAYGVPQKARHVLLEALRHSPGKAD
jgi:ADP-ribose pyrophosphatase YjhB (NUDIX family)